jgi:magnesium transporter
MTTDTLNEFHTKTLKLLKKLIGENREFDIIDLFSQMHPADIADLIDILQDEEKVRLFSLLDIEKASDVILEISDASKDRIIEELSSEKLTKIIDEMDSDDAADFIAELPEEQAETVLAGIEPEDVEDVKKLLQYPEDTAGGIMQSELVSVPDTALIRDAVSAVIQAAEKTEDIYSVFVVDAEGHLVGTVPLQKIITARRSSPVTSAIERDIPRVTVDVDQEQVVQIFKKYDLVTLPVVDKDERLVGRITVDDVVDVMEEETSEDIYRIAGVGEDDSPLSGPVQSVRKRLPWLYFNLLTALCSALVIGFLKTPSNWWSPWPFSCR